MSTFKNIRGKAIKSLASDPANTVGGDIWYNSTSQTLKGVVASGATRSGANCNTARSNSGSFGKSTRDDMGFAGGSPNGSANVANTEEYNGGWGDEVTTQGKGTSVEREAYSGGKHNEEPIQG